jgi:hypothetical protein
MQRLTTAVFVLVFAVALAFVIIRVDGGAGTPLPAVDAGAGGSAKAPPLEPLEPLDPELDEPLGLGLGEPLDEGARVDAGGTLLPSGEPAPGLPAEAPKSVVFGVVLVSYRGAQGALKDARTRDEALALADELATLAQTDFAAAVGRGDQGSLENAGSLPRGVLEPAPEYVLFSLDKGAVSEPVDTPRGFWIVKRIE